MSEALILAGSLFAGVLLGAFFFGGLWWTIRSSPPSQWSGLLFPQAFCSEWPSPSQASTRVSRRMAETVACLAGFLLARIAVTRLIHIPAAKSTCVLEEAGQ